MRRRDMEKLDAVLRKLVPKHTKRTTRIRKRRLNLPIELDFKASNRKLESVQIFERVEGQPSYGRSSRKRSE